MFASYYDAAGGRDHGFIVVAGWVSTLGHWERFEVDWRLALAEADIPYFHMKTFSQSKPPYESWEAQEGKRANLLRTLCGIVQSYVQFGVASYVEYEAFDIVNKSHCLNEWIGNPYSLAGRDCAKESTKWVLGQLGETHATPALPLQHIFEDGDEGKGLLMSLMEKDNFPSPAFKPSRDRVRETYPERLAFTEEGVIQLQAADFAAYELRKAKPLLERDAWLEMHRASMQALTEVPALRFVYKEPHLLKFCDDYGVPNRIASKPCVQRLKE